METADLTRGSLFWTDLCSYERGFWISNLNFSSCNCPIHVGVGNIVFPFKQPLAYFVLLTISPFIFSIPVLLAFPYRFPRPLTVSVAIPWAVSPRGFFLKHSACTGHCYPAVASWVAGGAWQYHIRLYPDVYIPRWRVVLYNGIASLTDIHLVIQHDHRPLSATRPLFPPPGSVKFVMPD